LPHGFTAVPVDHFSISGDNTVIHVSPSGGFAGGTYNSGVEGGPGFA
jgi:hypothetical protein